MSTKEIKNQGEITMSENEMVEFVNMYNGIVPKNQVKKFNGLELKDKVSKIKFYQDIIKMKEDARIKNSIPNKVKDLFETKHGTVEDAKAVMKFCNEFIESFKEREIERLDAEIAKLQAMKQSL